jgi:hypothetical protein
MSTESSGLVGWNKKGEVRVKVEAHVRTSMEDLSANVDGIWIAGGNGYLTLTIDNQSQKKVFN